MEFIMGTDLTSALPKTIDFNHEELKKELSERLKYYSGLVVTEDTVPEAKSDRAKLKKLREAIEDKRKEVKNQCLAPYYAFEEKVKELVALVDQPILAIDSQLKEYEEKRKEEKLSQIAEVYDTIIPDDLKEIIPLEAIMKPQWLNATVKIKKVEEELEDIAKRTKTDMMVLDSVEDEYKTAVRETYMQCRDVEKAIAKKASLQAAKEAFKQRDEIRVDISPSYTEKTPQSESQEPQETMYRLCLELYMTKPQSELLKSFLDANGINYRKMF